MREKYTLYLMVFVGLLASGFSFAGGLEDIIVEKYHVATPQDIKLSDGKLSKGSITYRIYADLAPGYTFQACYGSPTHDLLIKTTTQFYNHPNGAQFANGIPDGTLNNGTVGLDSWLSVGASSAESIGVVKTTPNDKGSVAGSPTEVSIFAIKPLLGIFQFKDSSKTNPTIFLCKNGAWSALGKGTFGPTPENRVLLAQLTTDGVLSFELNLQLGKPEGGSERYVARDPLKNEILVPALIYPSKVNPPKVNTSKQ